MSEIVFKLNIMFAFIDVQLCCCVVNIIMF